MSRDINLTSKEWCDIVFEGKNQKYGAYELRGNSTQRHIRSIVIMLCISVVLVFLPSLISSVIPKTVTITTDEVVRMAQIDLNEPDPEDIIPIEQIEVIPPTPALQAAIGYTPPVIDRSATDEDNMRTMDEVTHDDRVIFGQDIEGSDDPDAVDPGTLERITQVTGPTEPVKPKEREVIDYAEVMPAFPGGDGALMQYLNDNISYPRIAAENDIKGRVTVKFAIMENGSISRVSVVRGVHSSLDDEAIRLVKSMPRWIPGNNNGRPVSVYRTVTVTFNLEAR